MATLKHIASKNADYGAAEQYLTFEHDEFSGKPILDENGRLVPRQDYRIAWMYTKKVDKQGKKVDKRKKERGVQMSEKKNPVKYTEEFKKTLVTLYQSGKTYAQIQKEYGVSSSALSNWVRKYSQVKVDDDTILSAQQIKALQKRNAELEEENLILKKRLQSSRHTQTETEGHRRAVRPAFHLHPLPGARGQPQHLLQASAASALETAAGEYGDSEADFGTLRPI